jgi:poly(hydroxyalkanoate) depolymerase family esterase
MGIAAILLIPALGLAAGAHAADEKFLHGVHQGRAYRLYLPPSAAPARPLVVALHGCAQTPEDFALGTRLNRAAARRGLRVLYPAQDRAHDAARCWNWFAFQHQVPTSGEVAEILGLVREVQRAYRADTERVVVVGFSAGAAMAVNLTCSAPDIVRGIGLAAGGPYRCAESFAEAVACMRGQRLDGVASATLCAAVTGHAPTVRASLWQGEGDSVVSAASLVALTTMFVHLELGGSGRPSSLPTSSRSLDVVTERRDGAVRTLYRAADGRSVVEAWLVPRMGHAWSGGDARGSHTYPAGPDATEAMLRFLVDD